MTIAEWCVFGAVMLYLLTIAPFKAINFVASTIPSRATPHSLTIHFVHAPSVPTSTGSKPFHSSPPRYCWPNFGLRRSISSTS
jgi:hypothetical protein